MTDRIWKVLGITAYVAGYAALLAWFKWFDVYHNHFATAGVVVLIYNLARALFIFYLFWIVSAVGQAALRVAFGKPKGLDALEHQVLSFFTGAGIWHIAMLALGYLNLYTVPIAIAVTLPFVALSWPNVVYALKTFRWRAVIGPGISFRVTLGAALVVLFGFLLLMTKGLYPGGGHDYFTHYFQYYRSVIDSGGIWPNEVWYHYYYSRGAGLFFLGILLADPLAPQLVTYCFMAAAAAALYLIVRVGTSDRAWPWAAAALFLAAFINTPLWGEFEKQHEVNAAFVIAIAWMSARSLSTSGPDRAAYIAGTALAVTGAVIQNSTVAVFLGGSFVILLGWFAIKRQYSQSLLCFCFATVAGVALTITYAINYVTTGLVDDNTLLLFWQVANIEKIYALGTLQEVLRLHWGKTGMSEARIPLSESVINFSNAMRCYILAPLFASSFAIGATAVYSRWRKGHWPCAMTAPYEIAALSAMALVTAVLAVTVGQAQSVSFFRYCSFVIPVFLALGILIWEQPIATHKFALARKLRDWRVSFSLVSILIVLIVVSPGGGKREVIDSSPVFRSWHFLTGAYSIDTAYSRQIARYFPHGAIHPGARGAYAAVGPKTRIWSLNVQAFCMLPDCQVETVDSFTLGKGYPDIMFGSPKAGRAALQATDHNYFLFSKDVLLNDYLPRAPLFSPDNIAKYLGVRWTNGTSTLLTWIGPETTPLDQAWIAAYRAAVEHAPSVRSFPYAEMQSIFARLNATPHPWHSFELPWSAKY